MFGMGMWQRDNLLSFYGEVDELAAFLCKDRVNLSC